MMKRLAMALVLFFACALLAQAPTAMSAPASSVRRVIFERRWPEADPQWFELILQPDGNALYHSRARQDASAAAPAAEIFEFNFTLSPKSRQIVFSLAPGLSAYRDSLDKAREASTGSKSLRYDDGAGNTTAISYNQTASPELKAVTELLVGISETIEFSQTLSFQLRFDKLGLDTTLRGAEALLPFGRFPEPQILEPILTRIADDPSILNLARQRARRLLKSFAEGNKAKS
jgi:hypothetical protein